MRFLTSQQCQSSELFLGYLLGDIGFSGITLCCTALVGGLVVFLFFFCEAPRRLHSAPSIFESTNHFMRLKSVAPLFIVVHWDLYSFFYVSLYSHSKTWFKAKEGGGGEGMTLVENVNQ